MVLVGPKVFSFVVNGGQSHILRDSKEVEVTIESYGKVEISYINADFLKFVFILLDIGPAPRKFLLVPLNFCRTYIFYVKLF